MWRLRITVALAAFILPAILLAPVWRLNGLGAAEDDVLYYYPARVFFHDTLAGGQWPWLTPWTGLGRPFMADPQTAFWYPTTWLFALPGLPPLQAYAISLYLHYSLALWGTYRLLRGMHLGRLAALLGGIAFAFCGFMLAHRAHFTMQHAAAWTPVVLWRLQRYAVAGTTLPGPTNGAVNSIRLLAAAGALVMQCFAGHVQIAALTAVGALVFVLATRPPAGAGGMDSAPRSRRFARTSMRWLLTCVGALGLFALQWLPTFAYLRVCTRTERSYSDFVENSWHPASLLNWVTPMLPGQRTPNLFSDPYWGASHQVEQFGYAGLIPLALAVLALRAGWRQDACRRLWVFLGAFGALLALGRYGPLCPLLYWIPGSSLFRCPARALVLVDLAIAGLAAATFNELMASLSPERARLRASLLRLTSRPVRAACLVALVPMVLVLFSLPLLDNATRPAAWRAVRPWNPALWIPAVVALVSCAALGGVVRRWRNPRWLWLVPLVTAADLGVIGWTIDVPAGVTEARQLVTPRDSARWMDRVRESGQRLWVVNARTGMTPGEYIRPVDKCIADTNVLRGIEALADYGPLQPKAYVQRFGMQPWGESWKPAELLADTSWMRLYNVGWILMTAPPEDPNFPAPAGCELPVTTPEGWRLYHNPSAAGPALLERAGQPLVLEWERLAPTCFRTTVDTGLPPQPAKSGPTPGPAPRGAAGRLVFSQIALPGWSAQVNGRWAPGIVADGVLLGVELGGEPAEVVWSYFPPGLWLGAVVMLVTLTGFTAIIVWPRDSGERAEDLEEERGGSRS